MEDESSSSVDGLIEASPGEVDGQSRDVDGSSVVPAPARVPNDTGERCLYFVVAKADSFWSKHLPRHPKFDDGQRRLVALCNGYWKFFPIAAWPPPELNTDSVQTLFAKMRRSQRSQIRAVICYISLGTIALSQVANDGVVETDAEVIQMLTHTMEGVVVRSPDGAGHAAQSPAQDILRQWGAFAGWPWLHVVDLCGHRALDIMAGSAVLHMVAVRNQAPPPQNDAGRPFFETCTKVGAGSSTD